eukprot:6664862-Pyramimonas_sp.AAC.1
MIRPRVWACGFYGRPLRISYAALTRLSARSARCVLKASTARSRHLVTKGGTDSRVATSS